ncbi:MAG: cation:proton antiporter subunit C [Methanobacteriota archaeon]
MINGFNIGIILFLIGLYGIITNKNVIKIIMSMGIMGNGVVLFFISLGYVVDSAAPILTSGVENIVDPLPQALMLTMIVINLCMTALALTIVVWLYHEFGTLDLGEMR